MSAQPDVSPVADVSTEVGAGVLFPGPVRVRVPATSANLGPGFDSFGLALGMFDEHVATLDPEPGVRVELEGEGAGEVPCTEDHLVIATMRATFALMGVHPAGITLRCHNRIPHGRGLGSSASAIVAGVVLARGLVVDGHRRLPDDRALQLAGRIEGHPDNVAAALLGGFTIAWSQASGEYRAVRLEAHPGVVPVAFIPDTRVPTSTARSLLPTQVAHRDAAFNVARSALFVEAITRRPDLLLEATEDRLHQDARAGAMPASATLISRLRAAGVAAVVSGAGPTVLALTTRAVAGGLVDDGIGPELGFLVLPLDVVREGALVTS